MRRECREELGLDIEVGPLVDAWLFDVVPGRRVIIVCYSARVAATDNLVLSDEHLEVGLFADDELDSLALAAGYLAAIRRCRGWADD